MGTKIPVVRSPIDSTKSILPSISLPIRISFKKPDPSSDESFIISGAHNFSKTGSYTKPISPSPINLIILKLKKAVIRAIGIPVAGFMLMSPRRSQNV